MATIFTSLYPSQHGALGSKNLIDPKFMLLTEYLRNALYETIAVVSGIFISNRYGFSQGFSIFDCYVLEHYEISADVLTRQAIKYLVKNRENKFFLWIHYFDPHCTYMHHEDIAYSNNYKGILPKNPTIHWLWDHRSTLNDKDLQYVLDLYDEEITFTDNHIGILLDKISELDLMDNTVIILTADHGEEFMERDTFGHGKTVYDELLHVPLIMHIPKSPYLEGKRITSNIELKNIGKTILQICGISNNVFDGCNLLNIAKGDKKIPYVYSEGSYAWGEEHRKVAIISNGWKFIENQDEKTFELYNLVNDPGEQIDLFSSRLERLNKKIIEFQTKLSMFGVISLLYP